MIKFFPQGSIFLAECKTQKRQFSKSTNTGCLFPPSRGKHSPSCGGRKTRGGPGSLVILAFLTWGLRPGPRQGRSGMRKNKPGRSGGSEDRSPSPARSQTLRRVRDYLKECLRVADCCRHVNRFRSAPSQHGNRKKLSQVQEVGSEDEPRVRDAKGQGHGCASMMKQRAESDCPSGHPPT